MRGHREKIRRALAAAATGLSGFAWLASHGVALAQPLTPGADPHLFEAVYRAISDHYLEPITAESLAMSGLARLGTIDATLSVERDGRKVMLRQGRAVVLEQSKPAPDDDLGWGGVTTAIMDTARRLSAAVAPLDEDKLDATMIDGSITLLDRFTRYAPPTAAAEHRDSRDGYGGIGVTVDIQGHDVRIASVMPDTPAAAAGIASGDRITALDGLDVLILPHEELLHRLRGPIGSTVQLALARDGRKEPLKLTLKRAQIVLRTVTLHHDDHIAVVRITSFNARTADNLADALRQAHREMGGALQGIVLDLRNDPGGLLDQATEVASQFLEGGTVVTTAGRVPESRQVFDVDRHEPIERLPLVVLVNGGSASASEIVASALQDEGRAVIVGTASYGKGTVQNVVHLPNQGELTVTWARLIPPGGYILHEHGVVPAVCTAKLADSALAKPTPSPARATLDNAGWTALRGTCPPDRLERDLDLTVARQLLEDPARFARALAVEPIVAATRPGVRSASISTTMR